MRPNSAPRGAGGFSLVELTVAMAVSAIVAVALVSLCRTAALYQFQILNEQPLQETSAYIYHRIVADINAATCAQVINSGGALLLYQGRDCSGQSVGGSADQFQIYCVNSAGWSPLLYDSEPYGNLSSSIQSCAPGYSNWKALTLSNVQATGTFSTPTGVLNQIGASMTFRLDPNYFADSEELPFNATIMWQNPYL